MLDMEERTRKKRPKPKPVPRERLGENLNVWIPAELMAEFEAVRADTRRTKTAEVIVMMEQYVKSLGRSPRRP